MSIYCGQTAGWIKMPLGMEVYLGPGHTVLMGPSSKGAQHSSPLCGPCLLCPNNRPSQLLLSDELLFYDLQTDDRLDENNFYLCMLRAPD